MDKIDINIIKYKKMSLDDFIISIDRLLWTRVCAMGVDKYKKDLELLKEYYYKHYTNQKYHQEALVHENSYQKMNGAVFGGNYDDKSIWT